MNEYFVDSSVSLEAFRTSCHLSLGKDNLLVSEILFSKFSALTNRFDITSHLIDSGIILK